MSKCQCSIDIESYCDNPEFFTVKERKARKEHKCWECCRIIKRGETYRYESGMWEGNLHNYKTCIDCCSVRDAFFCSFVFGGIWDGLREELFENGGKVAQECIDELTPAAKQKVLDVIKRVRKDLHS